MTTELVLTLTGLALIDSINISTMWIIIVLLLGAQKPVASGWSYVVGAFSASLSVLLVLYFGASFAADSFSDVSLWMRRVIFCGLAVGLVVLGIRKLSHRPRVEIQLPAWVNAWTALFLGVLATIGDLPNSFPMFFAVERIIDAQIGTGTAIALLFGYNFLYAFPTLVILVIGLIYYERLRDRMQRAYDRHVTAVSQRNPKTAAIYFVGATASCVVLVFFT